jgi:hypothetical protein
MKTELTIKTDYLPNWGAFEGVRELLQNGKDAETEFHAKLEVRHKADTSTLIITNEGATLPREAMLFGHTTKIGQGNLIGKFGEGLKLGMLALVRAGHEVKIRSGSEVWLPKIERSEKFNADVLVIYIETGRQPKDRVQIEVSNVTKEDWALMRPCFLFLTPKGREDERIDTYYGALLLNEQDIGKVFVKGIFVEQDPQLKFGYDLTRDVAIDRDRKMVARYDLEWRVRKIWADSIVQRKDLVTKYLDMVFNNTPDVAGLDPTSAADLPEEVRNQAAARFKERHGDNAIPVDNMADSKDMEHLGKSGVLVVNKPLKAMLEAVFGTTDKIKSELANEITTHYGWRDLLPDERSNMESAIELVNAVEPVTLNDVNVVDFRSPSIVGMYKGGQILLSKVKLVDANMTLETVVHEVAHRFGGDGSHHHVAALERIWSGIVSNLRKA